MALPTVSTLVNSMEMPVEDAVKAIAVETNRSIDEVQKALDIATILAPKSVPWCQLYLEEWLPKSIPINLEETPIILELIDYLNTEAFITTKFLSALTQRALDSLKRDLSFREDAVILPEMEAIQQEWKVQLDNTVNKAKNFIPIVTRDWTEGIIFGRLETPCRYNNTGALIVRLGLIPRLTQYREQGGKWHATDVVTQACKGGHVSVLQYLKEDGFDFTDAKYCNFAAMSGNIACMKYLRSIGCPWVAWTMIGAIMNGHLKLVRYLHENGCPWDVESCNRAVKGNPLVKNTRDTGDYVDILQYLHENGCPWDITQICLLSIEGGYMKCLKYARNNGANFDASHCALAAENGRLDILRYLRQNGCPWDKRTCERAASHGQLKCLKFAHESVPPCPWDEETMIKAIKGPLLTFRGNWLHILKYLREQGCPWDARVCKMAVTQGDLKILRYLREKIPDGPCPWDSSVYQAAKAGNGLKCLKYLQENGCPQ